MSKKLYVGGLPYSVTSSQLEEMFSKFGKVNSCDLITDRYSGQSKGFGFVEMENDQDAEKAIKKLTGTMIGGEREITVNEARPREERPRSDNRGGSGINHRGSRRGSFH